MSASLERLKQRDEQGRQQPQPETSDTTQTTLTSILDVVEGQTRQLVAMDRRLRDLSGFVKVMDQEQAKHLDRTLQSLPPTSSPSSDVPVRIDSVESRLAAIETTLEEFVSALDGEKLNSAIRTLTTEASRNHTATASATEQAASQVAESTDLVKRAHGAARRIENQAAAAIEEVASVAAESATSAVTERVDAAHEKADKVMALASRTEARQLWTAAGAMCLALVPAAAVVLGGIIIVAGIVFGWEVAVTTEAATWLRVVRGLGAVLGTGCGLFGLAVLVRWVAGYVSTWKSSPRSIRGRW